MSKKKKQLRLTTRGRYAVIAMVELAKKAQKNPVPLVKIAESGDISLSYLEQLFSGLRRNGIVKSYRGPGGGYLLAKSAADITISEILHSAEDCIPAKIKAHERKAANDKNSQTGELWSCIGSILQLCMQHISLDDLINNKIDHNPYINKLFETLT